MHLGFQIFKIQVKKGSDDHWFIFRRYTDFVRLNKKLRILFPHFRLALPPKKWFGDNFDHNFLEDRMMGLQAFLNNIVGHRAVCNSHPVREFLCLDDPPGPHDSVEESRVSTFSVIYTCQWIPAESRALFMAMLFPNRQHVRIWKNMSTSWRESYKREMQGLPY